MLTPKEKAIELFNKFNNPDRTNYPYVHNAQQCALIAVDEILEVLESIDTPIAVALCYWYHEVKQEIANL